MSLRAKAPALQVEVNDWGRDLVKITPLCSMVSVSWSEKRDELD